MKNALIRLREHYHELAGAERTVAEYILKNPETASTLSVQELAHKSFSSPSAVVRMCHRINFDGYKDFKRSLTIELALHAKTGEQMYNEEIKRTDNITDIIRKVTAKNAKSLDETEKLMDVETLRECVKIMNDARNVILVGMGASLVTLRDLYLKLLRISKPCTINEDWHSQLLSCKNSTAEDVAIVCSYSGNTTEVITCMNALKENLTPIIAITRCVDTPVSKLADYKLYTTENESLLRTAAMSSRISQLNIIDILYTALGTMNYDETIKVLHRTYIEKPKN